MFIPHLQCWKIKMILKSLCSHFSPILPRVQWNWLGETKAPSCWIASDPTLSPPPAIMFLLHQLFTCIIPYQAHFTQSRDCCGWYEYVYVLAAAARTLWCKRREPEGSLLLHNKGRGSESLCLHELSTQSGLWPTSTERSEWKWTCGWSDSVVERGECVWERESDSMCISGACTEACKVSRQWRSTSELSVVSLLLGFLSIIVPKCLQLLPV